MTIIKSITTGLEAVCVYYHLFMAYIWPSGNVISIILKLQVLILDEYLLKFDAKILATLSKKLK